MSALLHWASRSPAQIAVFDEGRRDEEADEPLAILPRFDDADLQAYYLASREAAAEDIREFFWGENECPAP